MYEKQLLLNVALSRMSFLSAPVRGVLSEKLDNLDNLEVLSKIDLERYCGRELKRLRWNPHQIQLRAERDVSLMKRYAMELICWNDPRYPPLLREIAQPPFALFVRGTVDALAGGPNGMVGIVGTRRPDGEGIQSAFAMARDCVQNGITVVSGLASGIDSAAHRGALSTVTDPYAPYYCGPYTVAVCGTGLDTIFPSGNKGLAVQIMRRGGCLVSEYPPETPGSKWTFPERNRIISGLGFGVMVVEAPAKSGALITADFALEQNRELFLHPVGISYSRRVDRMNDIRTMQSLALEGATVTDSVHDILPHRIAVQNRLFPERNQLCFEFDQTYLK